MTEPDHPLITDEAVEAAARVLRNGQPYDGSELDQAVSMEARAAIAAFLAHVEGEKPCERCGGTGIASTATGGALCPVCGGTGKVPADRLVRRSEVAETIREMPVRGDLCSPEACFMYAADLIERKFGGER